MVLADVTVHSRESGNQGRLAFKDLGPRFRGDERAREFYRCRHTKAALTTKFHTVPISAPAKPASHQRLS